MHAGKPTIELVPRTCWWSNLRSVLPRSDWDQLRRAAYRSADYRCELCGGVGPTHPVEAHERWVYDDDRRIQRLDGLWALCPDCHSVKHLGRTMAVSSDGGRRALAHMATVNGWSMDDATAYAEASFEVWALRSQHEWTLDLDWLVDQGVEVPDGHERQR